MASAVTPLLLAGGILAAGPAGQEGQPTPRISFSGRVLDSQGQPVPDAKVVLYEVDYGGGGGLPNAERTREVVTGPDGAFLLTAAKGSDDYQQGSVIAQKEGRALGWAAWEMRQGPQQSDIILGEPEELSGTVVDEAGTPVVEAEVSVALAIIGREEDRRYLAYFVAPQLLTVKTDGRGRFVFRNMPAEATFELLAAKPGRATTCTFDPTTFRGEKCQFSPGQAGIKLTLPPEARIEGKVVEAGGQPLGGIQLVAQPDRRGLSLGVEPVTSAPDGTFFVGNLAAGSYAVQPVPPREGAAEWVAEPARVTLKAGETVRDVGLALTKGGFVEVVVKDEAGGKPIERASVSIRGVAREQWFSGRTDAAGVARIRLAPGDYELRSVYKRGYMYPEQSEAFTLAEGETKRFEQTLGSLPSITGVVYDDAGKALENAAVRVVPGGSSGSETVSDAQGVFQASWDPRNWSQEGMVFYIVARHPQRNLAAAQPLDTEAGRVEVKLRPAVTLTGQVVDPNGKGIEGADIRMMFRAATWGSTFLPYRSVKTDAQGRYEVPAIPADQRYNINASAEGYGQGEANLEAEEVTGARVQVATCTLAVANLSVSGVVVDPEGKPVPNARVSCWGDGQTGQPDRQTQADTEGKFTLAGVCAGRIRIQANAEIAGVYNYGNIETDGGATDLRIAVGERSSGPRYVPRRAASLRGKRLPDLKKLGVDLPADANDRILLVCFWDMNQRPSRHCLSELMRQAAALSEKGVTIVAIHAAHNEHGVLEQWVEKNKPPFPVGRIAGDFQKTQLDWGAASLPHLILTDRKHVVNAEGFALLAELDKKIETMPNP